MSKKKSIVQLINHSRLFALVIIFMFLTYSFVFVSSVSCSEPISIMPLGDSITRGDQWGGYRRDLYNDLAGNGYNVDFVGSLQDGSSSGFSFDYDHEGHGGWNDGQIASTVYGFLTANPADFVLLHIGTNGIDPSPYEVELILNEIDRFSEDIVVVLARIINRNVTIPEVTEFNDNVEAMANVRIADGDKIVIVDMESALNYPDDMIDLLHPNQDGYNKMANVWYNALRKILPNPNSVPIADFSIQSSTTPGVNETISFTDNSRDTDGTITSWNWNFGDSGTSTDRNPIHTYSSPGTYTIRLTVRDNEGATATKTKKITIYEISPPITTEDYDGLWHNTDFTINLAASDDDSGVAETYYRINAGATKQVGEDGQPLITFEGANNSLEYWSVDNVGNEEAHKILTSIKLDKTSPSANSGQDITVNEDASMNFDGRNSNDNIGISSYRWEFFDGSQQVLTGSNPQYSFNTPGEYVVNLLVTDSALNSASDSVIVTVLDITAPNADAGDDHVIHQGDTVSFDGSKSNDNIQILNYTWTFIDGSPRTLVGINPDYVFDSAGIFEIILSVSDAQGNSATDTVLVTVVDITFPLANAGVDRIVDEDTLVSFDGSRSSDNVGITSFVWSFTASEIHTLNGEAPSYVFETPGVYVVTLIVSDAEGHSSNDTVSFTVLDKTAPIIEIEDFVSGIEDVLISFDASRSYDNIAIANYTWIFGDGSTENSSVPSVSHIFADSNIYDVELDVTDTSGNTNTTYITAEVKRDTDGDLIADQADTDDDDDGMPDTWELNYGLNPLDPSDASLDSDSDTIINLLEYQQNTNPNSYDFTIYTLAIILVGLGIFSAVILGLYYIRTSRKKIKI